MLTNRSEPHNTRRAGRGGGGGDQVCRRRRPEQEGDPGWWPIRPSHWPGREGSRTCAPRTFSAWRGGGGVRVASTRPVWGGGSLFRFSSPAFLLSFSMGSEARPHHEPPPPLPLSPIAPSVPLPARPTDVRMPIGPPCANELLPRPLSRTDLESPPLLA